MKHFVSALAAAALMLSAGVAEARGGFGNRAIVNQSGEGHQAVIAQSGTDNVAALRQIGQNNSATIQQSGNGNTGCLVQLGRNHSATLVQSGGDSVGYLQGPRGTREIPVQGCVRMANGGRR